MFPETIGEFTLYSPDISDKTAWSMAMSSFWIPAIFDSRDTCLVVMGMLMTDQDETENLLSRIQTISSSAITLEQICEFTAQVSEEIK